MVGPAAPGLLASAGSRCSPRSSCGAASIAARATSRRPSTDTWLHTTKRR